MIDNNEINAILSDYLSNERVQEMKRFVQHGSVSTYEHCLSVARLSYRIDRALGQRCDPKVLLVGALLHDFYLYDWHDDDGGTHRLHGFRHAKTACLNARQCFDIDEKTGRVIESHMWPLNPERVPPFREAWIVCVADKCVSLHETLFGRRPKKRGADGDSEA